MPTTERRRSGLRDASQGREHVVGDRDLLLVPEVDEGRPGDVRRPSRLLARGDRWLGPGLDDPGRRGDGGASLEPERETHRVLSTERLSMAEPDTALSDVDRPGEKIPSDVVTNEH